MTVKNQKTSVAAMPQAAVGEKEYLTAPEACVFLGIKQNYLYKLTSSHRLPYYCPSGRKILFKRKELQAWIEKSRVSTDEELSAQAELELIKKGGLR